MIATPRAPISLIVLAFALAGCGDSGGGTRDADQDTSPSDTVTTDTVTTDTVTTDTSATDTAEDTVPNDLGFAIRYPATHTIPCDDPSPEFPVDDLETPDADWLCTFAYGGDSGYVYLRATPTGCVVMLGGNPVYDDCAGWIAVDGVVSPVTEAAYDWGGNHHNDSLAFAWDGKRFSYDHSSYGYGFRKCQEMDCLVVRDGDGALIEDGCTKERTLPAVCRQIGTDGTWGTFEDTFAPCLGDPNY